jgi:hypothetical protein
MKVSRLALVVLVLVLPLVTRPSLAADAVPPPPSNGISLVDQRGAALVLTAQQIAALPSVRLTTAMGMMHGSTTGTYVGPLLWTVMQQARAFRAETPRQQAGQTILITGSDGYVGAVAVGEIAPAFEGKHVILAERANSRPLGLGHLWVIVPGDRMGGRSVRDVVRIAILPTATPPK